MKQLKRTRLETVQSKRERLQEIQGISIEPTEGEETEVVDTYLDRLKNHIPVEIMTAYTAIAGLLASQDKDTLWGFVIVMWVLVVVWELVLTDQQLNPEGFLHLAMTFIAFGAWMLYLSGEKLLQMDQEVSSSIVIVAGLIITILEKFNTPKPAENAD